VTSTPVSPPKARSATRWTAALAALPALAVGAVLYGTTSVGGGPTPLSAATLDARSHTTDAISAPIPTATPDPASYAQKIEIILPPPPPPPAPTGTGKKPRNAQAAAAAAASGDHLAYCAAGGGAIASATTLDGLLAAANAERAQFGYASLSWSSGLAGVAQGWANQLVANDEATAAPHDAIAHNPNRPRGGENVAMSYKSSGLASSRAISKAHAGWMLSENHCTNLLNPTWSVMGAGTAQTADGSTWYTVVNYQ